MEPTIFRFVLRYSLREQILVILLTAVSMPFVYLALEVPKRIINQAIGGEDIPPDLFGWPLDQISYLFLLCGLFLLLTFINGGFKYVINVYRGTLGERMLRRLRYQLYNRLLRFPLPHYKQVSQGEIIPMITAETEPLGGFIGDAFALPAFQGGLLLTYLLFIFNQDPLLGLVATSMYPLQAYVIPKLQKKVNLLARQRVMTVRKLADRLGESIAGVTEIHANDTSQYERADIGNRLGDVYRIRFEIYKRKFFIKFFNNFLTQVTPFFFYAAGGYYVIMGELTLGALVAALAAYKDVAAPWNELLKFYQIKEDVRVKYDQIIEQFEPPGLLEQRLIDERPTQIPRLQGEVNVSYLVYGDDHANRSIDGVSLRFGLDQWVAVAGGPNSGKYDLGRLLAGLLKPDSGSIHIGEQSLSVCPQSVLGQRIGYVDSNPHLFAGSVLDNLLYGLMHLPAQEAEVEPAKAEERKRKLRDARLSGNSEYDRDADWIDYASAGVAQHEELEQRCLAVLDWVELRDDLFQFGLRSQVDGDDHPELAAGVLEARRRLSETLSQAEHLGMVEPFDPEHYNQNASLAENLVFGSTRDSQLDLDTLAGHPYVRQILQQSGLSDRLLEVGRQVAQTMIELFADLPPGHEFFQQFAFINAEDLPEFQAILARIDKQGLSALSDDETNLLLSLAFRLVPGRHRLGLLDDEIQARVVAARSAFARDLPEDLAGRIELLDVDRFNPAISVQDNILFGRIVYGQAYAESRLGELLNAVVEGLDLSQDIVRVGLDYSVGTGGSRLSNEQKQKIALLRAMLKQPDWLVVNGGSSALESGTERRLLQRLRETRETGAVWILDRLDSALEFDQLVVLENGRVAENGEPAQLQETGEYLKSRLAR